MAGKKGSLSVKNPVPMDELQKALNPANPTGQGADASDITGGAGGVEVQEKYQHIQEQPLEAAQKEANDSLGDKVRAAWEESYTGYILKAQDQAFQDAYSDYDPSFDPTRRAQDLITRMGLEASEDNLRALGRAGTADDQLEIAQRLADHQTNQEILNRHGGYALASGLLDPATLITDFATFGTTRALKLGRLASGTMGAVAGTALVGAADAAGKSTTGFDYLLNATLTGGAMALFGGEAATRIAAGEGGWFGRVSKPGTDGVFRPVNNFLSETDKLTPTPESVDLMKNLVDDPVRREGLLVNDNAASYHRRYTNEADGFMQSYDTMLEQGLRETQGWSFVSRKMDLDGKYGEARDALNRQVAQEMLRRNHEFQRFGQVADVPQLDPLVKRLADEADRMMVHFGNAAKEAGVRGFDDFKPQPGYFHRSWNASLIRGMEAKAPGMALQLIKSSALRGIQGIDADGADAIARALLQRTKDKAAGTRSDFLGGLGKTDNAFIRESLELAKVSQARIDSIMAKIETKASDQGTTKYGKHRLSFDMTVSITAPDGNTYRMMDLIDTDLDRVFENYTSSMAGRMALAKAGIAGDDAGLEAFKRSYLKSIESLPQAKQDDLMQQLDGLLGDFTGNRPEANQLSQFAQRVKSVADATMLSASGFWQVAEYSTIAARHGVFETGREFMRTFPGVRQLLKKANATPDLAEEMHSVLHLDLARDVRVRPWKRQHDVNLQAGDTALDRILHAGKQAVPYLNAMKFVHLHQARLNANLVLNKFARAAAGDGEALSVIKQYAPDLPWERVQATIRREATYRDAKNVESMNWAAWPKEDIDTVMNAALRMMDDTLLFGRAGQGASFSRSAVGQVLGQFQSFVSFAHNKLLRGTLANGGVKGLALLLAYQYPATFLMMNLNEARKGNLDLSENGQKKVAKKAIGYTAGLGFIGSAVSIVGLDGGRGGISTPLMGLADAPMRALGGASKMFNGEYREGSADVAKAAAQVLPFINAMPGTAMVLDAWKGE